MPSSSFPDGVASQNSLFSGVSSATGMKVSVDFMQSTYLSPILFVVALFFHSTNLNLQITSMFHNEFLWRISFLFKCKKGGWGGGYSSGWFVIGLPQLRQYSVCGTFFPQFLQVSGLIVIMMFVFLFSTFSV